MYKDKLGFVQLPQYYTDTRQYGYPHGFFPGTSQYGYPPGFFPGTSQYEYPHGFFPGTIQYGHPHGWAWPKWAYFGGSNPQTTISGKWSWWGWDDPVS